MSQVNDTYIAILTKHHVNISVKGDHNKYLKDLILEQLHNVQSVKSVRRRESDKLVTLVLSSAVSKVLETRTLPLNKEDTVCHTRNVANILREELMLQQKWSFDGEERYCGQTKESYIDL